VGKNFNGDVGIQAVRGPFGVREVEDSLPLLAVPFGNKPKGIDMKIMKRGRIKGACYTTKFKLLQEVFFQ